MRINVTVWRCSIVKRSFVLYNLTSWAHLCKSLYARVTWSPLKQQTCTFREVSHADVMAACTSACWNHLNSKKMRQRRDEHHAWAMLPSCHRCSHLTANTRELLRRLQMEEKQEVKKSETSQADWKTESAWVQMSEKGPRVCARVSLEASVPFLLMSRCPFCFAKLHLCLNLPFSAFLSLTLPACLSWAALSRLPFFPLASPTLCHSQWRRYLLVPSVRPSHLTPV